MSVTLTPVETLNIGIVGLGSEGCRLVDDLELNPNWEVSVALWDSCRNSLNRFSGNSKRSRNLGVKLTHGLGCVGQYELGRSIFLEEQDYCREWLLDKDIILVAGALGGGFTGGFWPEFAKAAKSTNTLMFGCALMPFSFEGQKRMNGARHVLGKLRETCMAVVNFEGDDYLGYIDEAGFAQPSVEQLARESGNVVAGLVAMLLEQGVYDFNLATLSSAFDLDVAKTSVIAGECSDEVGGVDLAIQSLMERIDQKLPEKELRVDRLLITVIGGKGMAASAVNQINREVTARFAQPGKTFFGASIRDDFEGLRIIVFVSIHLGKQFEWVDLSEHESQGLRSINTQSRKSAKKKSAERKRKGGNPVEDEEQPQVFFDTILNESNRGYFDDTSANSLNGVDLDVPTYIRRGIRVKT